MYSRQRFALVSGSLFFLAVLKFSCSVSNKDNFIVSKTIDSVLTKKIGTELLNRLKVNLDSSFLTDNNKRVRFSEVNDLNNLKNTSMVVFLYLASETTQQHYHLLTVEIDKKNEISRFEVFVEELEKSIGVDTITFYNPQKLIDEFNHRYGNKAKLDTLENGKVWEVTLADYGSDTKYFNLQINGYYRKDTFPNGMIWSDGYYLSYNLLSKAYMGRGDVSRGHSLRK